MNSSTAVIFLSLATVKTTTKNVQSHLSLSNTVHSQRPNVKLKIKKKNIPTNKGDRVIASQKSGVLISTQLAFYAHVGRNRNAEPSRIRPQRGKQSSRLKHWVTTTLAQNSTGENATVWCQTNSRTTQVWRLLRWTECGCVRAPFRSWWADLLLCGCVFACSLGSLLCWPVFTCGHMSRAHVWCRLPVAPATYQFCTSFRVVRENVVPSKPLLFDSLSKQFYLNCLYCISIDA